MEPRHFDIFELKEIFDLFAGRELSMWVVEVDPWTDPREVDLHDKRTNCWGLRADPGVSIYIEPVYESHGVLVARDPLGHLRLFRVERILCFEGHDGPYYPGDDVGEDPALDEDIEEEDREWSDADLEADMDKVQEELGRVLAAWDAATRSELRN